MYYNYNILSIGGRALLDIQLTVAENTKRIREQKKLTLDAAAALTGVSRSMLAQIERGDVNPTISVLWKIAGGYRVSFTSLVEGTRQQPVVVRGDTAVPMEEDGGRYVICPAFTFDGEKQFETYRVAIQPGGHLEAQPHMPGTEEFITVFCGQAKITAGEGAYLLKAGDSLRFPADQAHSYQNPGDTETHLHMLIWYQN
jgi:transcriptional regulator with XRE-family HTH domain